MPPAISDDEMDDVDVPDEIPARKGKAEPAEEQGEDDDDDDEDDDDEDSYQVEKILGHNHDSKGNVLYEIKWLGYDEAKDRTWEPLDNLEGAKVVLEAYHESIGGAPGPLKKGASTKKAKNNKRASEAVEDSPAPSKKRGRKSETTTNGKGQDLPLGSWEDDVQRIEAIVQDTETSAATKKNNQSLKGLLLWTSGRKTEHAMEALRQKCPQKLLDYYEAHLKFVD